MPAADRAAAAGGMGPADLAARRPGLDVRGLPAARHRTGRPAAGDGGGEGRTGRRDRAGAPRRHRRPLGAAAGGSGGGTGLRLDAGAAAGEVARGGIAAGDLRPCRLERAERDAGRGRRAGGLGDAWARGSADPRRRPDAASAAGRCGCSGYGDEDEAEATEAA